MVPLSKESHCFQWVAVVWTHALPLIGNKQSNVILNARHTIISFSSALLKANICFMHVCMCTKGIQLGLQRLRDQDQHEYIKVYTHRTDTHASLMLNAETTTGARTYTKYRLNMHAWMLKINNLIRAFKCRTPVTCIHAYKLLRMLLQRTSAHNQYGLVCGLSTHAGTCVVVRKTCSLQS